MAELLDELVQTPDFDVTVTGFDLPDAHELIAESLHAKREEQEEYFDVETALDTDGPPITQPGQLIELGRHRLICADSSDPRTYTTLLGEDQIDLLFADPPYNVDYYGGSRPQPAKARPKQSRQWRRIYADNLDQDDYAKWLATVLSFAITPLVPGGAFYVWNGHRQFGPMSDALIGLGLHVSCVITWAKESFAIGYGDYNQQTELCLYGWKPVDGKGAHRWFGPTNESTLWRVNRAATRDYEHPTQKPLVLAERAIRNSTRACDLVLDCFLGGGTTLISADRAGRRCAGIEIDPRYCDVIVRRYLAFVGEDSADPDLVRTYIPAPGSGAIDGCLKETVS